MAVKLQPRGAARPKRVREAGGVEAKKTKPASKPTPGFETGTKKKNGNALHGDVTKPAPHPAPKKPVLDVAETAPGQKVIELKNLALDASGRTAPQKLTLPADVNSVLIEVKGPADQWVLVDSLTGPGAKALVVPSPAGKDALDGPEHGPNPTVPVMHGSSALLAPNNPAVKLKGGAWTFTAAGRRDDATAGTGSVDVRITISSGPPKTHGKLPLNLYFASDRAGFRSKDAKQSPIFDAALTRLKEIYAGAGIEIGPIRMFDRGPVETAKGKQSAAIVDSARLEGTVTPEELLKTSSEAKGLNVFLTEGVYLDQGQVGGVSGSLPGPVAPGSTSSGVIFSINAPLDQPNPFYGAVLGATMAHEIGHYLGLAHTVEATGQEDRLPDTGATTDSPGNVMHWSEMRADRDFSLTPEQAEVMLRHPLVQ